MPRLRRLGGKCLALEDVGPYHEQPMPVLEFLCALDREREAWLVDAWLLTLANMIDILA